MSERDGYIPGVPCWVDTQPANIPNPPSPSTAASSAGISRNACRRVGGEVLRRLQTRRRRGRRRADPEGAPPMAMWNTYIWVNNADETATKAREAGGRVVMEPFDVMQAGRMAVLTDPEGAVFFVWQAKDHKGAKVVNEHGSLNFNGLGYTGPRGRKGLLRRRVRLENAELALGLTMWALPGYGDHLEEAQPRPAGADGADGVPAQRFH